MANRSTYRIGGRNHIKVHLIAFLKTRQGWQVIRKWKSVAAARSGASLCGIVKLFTSRERSRKQKEQQARLTERQAKGNEESRQCNLIDACWELISMPLVFATHPLCYTHTHTLHTGMAVRIDCEIISTLRHSPCPTDSASTHTHYIPFISDIIVFCSFFSSIDWLCCDWSRA